MSRNDPRPQTWKVQGLIPHQQHIAWHRARAQAHYRGEAWELTFEDFQELWQHKWDQRGKSSDAYCMTRIDPDGAWSKDNAEIVTRLHHLQNAQKLRPYRDNIRKKRCIINQES